jgi:hypothetical protein
LAYYRSIETGKKNIFFKLWNYEHHSNNRSDHPCCIW